MRLADIHDLDLKQVQSTKYDLAVFCSGYEQRATHAPKKLEDISITKTLILGFNNYVDNPQRVKNDSYYSQKWPSHKYEKIGGDDENILFSILRNIIDEDHKDHKDHLNILIDYSSMSRLWYANMLSWAKHAIGHTEITIDFLYSLGEYRVSQSPMEIEKILSIPGCSGTTAQKAKSVAILGLGFDGLATSSVLDKLEPDIVYTYLAAPGAFKGYEKKARKINDELIKRSKAILPLPLRSVELTFAYLVELIAPYKGIADITIIPMGPKPHILAALLVSMYHENIICLRVSGHRDAPPQRAKPQGEIITTRVRFTDASLNHDSDEN